MNWILFRYAQEARLDSAQHENLPPDVLRARRALKARGWSYRRACGPLGVSYTQLALVMTGCRKSRRLLAAIHNLPRAH